MAVRGSLERRRGQRRPAALHLEWEARGDGQRQEMQTSVDAWGAERRARR